MNRQERRELKRKARKLRHREKIEDASLAVQQAFQASVDAYQNGRLDEADIRLAAIEADCPGIGEVSHLRAVIALDGNHLDQATAHLKRALAADRRNPTLQHLLGVTYHGLGKVDDGVAAFRKALAIDANNPETHFAMGNLLREAGRFTDAVACYQRALELDSDFADARRYLGISLGMLKRWNEAHDVFDAALAADPDQAEVQIAQSEVCAMLRRYGDAERHARAGLERIPNAVDAHNKLSLALQGQGRIDEARSAIRAAIAQSPDEPSLYVNLGDLLASCGDADGAEAAYRKAIRLEPDHGGAHFGLGALLLRVGRYEEGWREYDWGDVPWEYPVYPQPRWNGADLTGKTILAWADEGAGDEIQHASLLPELIAQAQSCIVVCDARLAPVFARSFPEARVHARKDKPDRRLLSDAIDFQTPFSELTRWLRPDIAAAPTPEKGYLLANEAMTQACRARYCRLGDGLTVGIAWSSGNTSRPDRNAPLALWEPILRQPGVQFVSLQYGDHAAELAETRERFGVEIFVDPEVDQLRSLEQFAAQVAAMDLVISITNTTVHMAGALGRPVWTMLPHVAHWRYREKTEATMWYPHMRLFRQSEPWRWNDVIERVGRELAAFRAAAV